MHISVEDLARAFAFVDKDRSNSISAEEIVAFMWRLQLERALVLATDEAAELPLQFRLQELATMDARTRPTESTTSAATQKGRVADNHLAQLKFASRSDKGMAYFVTGDDDNFKQRKTQPLSLSGLQALRGKTVDHHLVQRVFHAGRRHPDRSTVSSGGAAEADLASAPRGVTALQDAAPDGF